MGFDPNSTTVSCNAFLNSKTDWLCQWLSIVYNQRMDKQYIDANELILDSFRLAANVYESGFRPNLIIGVWRGGAPVAIAIHEYFNFMNWGSDHISIRALSYTGINNRTKEVKLSGLEYIFDNTNKSDHLLIVDDVFDTGNSFKAIIDALISNFGNLLMDRVKIACPWYKPKNNQTKLKPDYYLHKTDQWLVFPHELMGLSMNEVQQNKKDIFNVINQNPNA